MCTMSMRAVGFSADKKHRQVRACRLSCSGLSACAGGVRCRSTAAAACAAASAVACVAVCRHCANSASDLRSPSTSNSSQTTCAGEQAAAKRMYRTGTALHKIHRIFTNPKQASTNDLAQRISQRF